VVEKPRARAAPRQAVVRGARVEVHGCRVLAGRRHRPAPASTRSASARGLGVVARTGL